MALTVRPAPSRGPRPALARLHGGEGLVRQIASSNDAPIDGLTCDIGPSRIVPSDRNSAVVGVPGGMTGSLPEQSPQQRRTARIAGWLMASTFLTSIPAALILYDPVLNNTNYILGAGDDTRVTLGVIGGPLIFLSSIAVLFGAYEQDGLHALFSIPEGAFEAAFAIYLIVKGFRASPILDDARFAGGGGGSLRPATAP